jgi:hypothetical protein
MAHEQSSAKGDTKLPLSLLPWLNGPGHQNRDLLRVCSAYYHGQGSPWSRCRPPNNLLKNKRGCRPSLTSERFRGRRRAEQGAAPAAGALGDEGVGVHGGVVGYSGRPTLPGWYIRL